MRTRTEAAREQVRAALNMQLLVRQYVAVRAQMVELRQQAARMVEATRKERP